MLASGVAPAILGATDKTDSKPKVIGPEGHRYEVHHDFMKVPDHIRWQDTHGVAVDAEGLIYVKHRTKTAEVMDSIVVFDAKGKFVRSFGKEYHGGGHGIDIRRDGGEEFLYLCDNKGYIAKKTLQGETVWQQTAPKVDVYKGAKPYVVKTPGKYGKGTKLSHLANDFVSRHYPENSQTKICQNTVASPVRAVARGHMPNFMGNNSRKLRLTSSQSKKTTSYVYIAAREGKGIDDRRIEYGEGKPSFRCL